MKLSFVKIILWLGMSVLSLNLQAADEGTNYTLTRQYGSVFFKVDFQKYLKMVGRFDDYSGTLYLDTEDMTNSRLEATLNMGSLNMAQEDVVETLVYSSSWFNANLYPESTFISHSVEVTGDMSADFIGELTFMGITKPWTLHIQFFGGVDGELAGSTVGMQATGKLDRTEFGLDEYMNMAVASVDIEINVKFNQD